MSVTVTAPKNSVVNRKNNVTITWTTTLQGQNAYEVQYKLTTSSSWNTFGKVSSTARSAAINMSGLTDGTKYHYRLILYHNYTDTVGVIYTGYEISEAYTIIPVTNQLGTLKIKVASNSTEEIPLYSETNKGGAKIKIRLNNTSTVFGLPDTGITTEMGGRLRTRTSSTATTNSIKPTATFSASGIKPAGYIDNRYSFQYYVPEKWNYAYQYATKYAGYYEPYKTGQTYSYHSGYYYIRTDTWYTTDYATGSYSVKHSSNYQVIHYHSYNVPYQYSPGPGQYGTAYRTESVYAYTENGTNYWYTTYSYTYISGYTKHSNDVYGNLYSYADIYSYRPAYAYYTFQYYYRQYAARYAYQYAYSRYTYS